MLPTKHFFSHRTRLERMGRNFLTKIYAGFFPPSGDAAESDEKKIALHKHVMRLSIKLKPNSISNFKLKSALEATSIG